MRAICTLTVTQITSSKTSTAPKVTASRAPIFITM
jgi:hypothetical protein